MASNSEAAVRTPGAGSPVSASRVVSAVSAMESSGTPLVANPLPSSTSEGSETRSGTAGPRGSATSARGRPSPFAETATVSGTRRSEIGSGSVSSNGSQSARAFGLALGPFRRASPVHRGESGMRRGKLGPAPSRRPSSGTIDPGGGTTESRPRTAGRPGALDASIAGNGCSLAMAVGTCGVGIAGGRWSSPIPNGAEARTRAIGIGAGTAAKDATNRRADDWNPPPPPPSDGEPPAPGTPPGATPDSARARNQALRSSGPLTCADHAATAARPGTGGAGGVELTQ